MWLASKWLRNKCNASLYSPTLPRNPSSQFHPQQQYPPLTHSLSRHQTHLLSTISPSKTQNSKTQNLNQNSKNNNVTTEGFEPSLFRTSKHFFDRPETCAITTRPRCRACLLGLSTFIYLANKLCDNNCGKGKGLVWVCLRVRPNEGGW